MKHEKYYIPNAKLYHPVKSCHENFSVCGTCQKNLYKNEIPCQAVCNKMDLDLITDELKDLQKLF